MIKPKAAKVKRSSIPDIRRDMLDRGALLFRFERPADVPHEREHVVWFERMQEVGFIVTSLGCVLPYENFRGSSKGRPGGHKISARFFLGAPPPPPVDGHPHGWPTETQVGHRCHRKDCINPAHIVYEPRWKNLKRNYCGERGACDCGVRPSCLATYRNDGWRHADEPITYSTDGYRGLVARLIPGRRFVILSPNHYESVDNRKRKRNEKSRDGRKKVRPDADGEKEVPPAPSRLPEKGKREHRGRPSTDRSETLPPSRRMYYRKRTPL